MLTTFRKSVKNFLGVGIILILCLAFAVWGAGSLTPSGAGTIAKVGSVEIPTQEFERQFRNEVSRIAVQMGGAFTEADARANGFHLGVLNQMIERAALDAQSDAIGLTTSDAELAAAIRDIPAFQNPVTAQFDREVYGRFLANQGLSVARFERDLRGDLVRGQLLDALMSAPAGAGPLAEAIYLRQAETRQIEYLLIQPELAGEPAEPTEEDLRAFHSANAARYTAPEYRSMTVAAFTPDLAIDEVELSEEDLQQAYNFRIDEFVTPERRTVRVLRYDDRDAADTALQRLGAGAAFATLAEEQGSNLDGVTRTLAIASDFLDPAVGEAAFSAEVGLADEPVEGAFAFSVIEVVEIAAAETTPFDDVRDDLRKDLAREAGLGIVFDLAGRFDELRQDGMTLREAATELEIDVIELNAVDATGLGPGGAPIEAVTLPRETLLDAFDIEPGDETDLMEMGENGYVAVAVGGVTPSALTPFEELRDNVLADWKGDWLSGRLQEITDGVVGRLESGVAFADVAAEYDRGVLARTITQGARDETLSQSSIARILSADVGDVVTAPAALGASRIVAKVTAIEPPETTTVEARAVIDGLEGQLSNAIANETLQAYISALRTDLGETINEAQLAALFPANE